MACSSSAIDSAELESKDPPAPKKYRAIANWLFFGPIRTKRLALSRNGQGLAADGHNTVAIERNVTNKQDMESWQTLPAMKACRPQAIGKLRRIFGRVIATSYLDETLNGLNRRRRTLLRSKKESTDLKEVMNRSDTQRARTPTKPFGGWTWDRDGIELATGMLIRLRMTWPVLDLQ